MKHSITRFHDRLVAGGYTSDPATAAMYAAGRYGSDLEDATVVVCDNVADYWETVRHEFMGPGMERHFPNIVPPISPAFFEAEARGSRDLRYFGGLCLTHDLEKSEDVFLGPAFDASFLRRLGIPSSSIAELPAPARDGARFMVEWWLFYEGRAGGLLGDKRSILGHYCVPTDETGAMIVDRPHPLRRTMSFVGNGDQQEGRAALMAGQTLLLGLYLAVSFMHCKNVTLRTVEPPKLSPHLARKGKRPLVRYHILDIDPMREVLNREGGAERHGLKKALHICRGHFATYTPDKPLFGRVTGTFWKPQHVRGSAQHGAVIKDYNVKAPRGQ